MVLRLTLLDDHVDASGVETSLRLPGPTDAAKDQPGIQVVLYAATPGAFVDMAADLAFLTAPELDTADLDQHQGRAGEPDITDVLQTEAALHEAIGVLIARGRTREQAYAELDTLADAAHTNRITEATSILTTLTPNGPDTSTHPALDGDRP